MKKNNLSLVILALLSVVFMFVGMTLIRPASNVFAADAASIQMVPGASIRVGEPSQDDPNVMTNFGVRFMAEVPVSEYEALVQNNASVTAGMFIAPYYYVTDYSTINEETCFTAKAQKYTWADKEVLADTTDGEVEILHVPNSPTKQDSLVGEGKVYRINGSVVGIKDKNLDLNYIGVAYIKVVDNAGNVDYIFTETLADNSRSPVLVAQRYLNEDVIPEGVESISTSYLQTYLTANNGSVTQTVNYDVYENGSNGFEVVENGSTEVVFDSVEDFTTSQTVAPERESAVFIKGLSDATTVLPEIGKTYNLKYYYEKTVGNAVLFDSGRATSADDLYSSNGATNNSVAHSAPSNDWGFNGNSSILFDDYGTDVNAGIIYNNPITLPAPTNTISFWVKNNGTESWQESTTIPNVLRIYDGSNSVYGAFKLKAGVNEVYQITVKLNETISQVNNIIFVVHQKSTSAIKLDEWMYGSEFAGTYEPCFTNGSGQQTVGEYNPVYIDFIQAEYPLIASDSSLTDITLTEQDITLGYKEITLPTYTSTVYNSKELSNGATVTYKQLPSGQAQELTVTNGKVRIPVQESCTYQLDYNFNLGGTTKTATIYIHGYYPYMVDTFENSTATVSDSNYIRIEAGVGLNGSYGLRTHSTGAAKKLNYATSPFTANANVSTICLWIYNPTSETHTLVGTNAAAPGGIITTERVPISTEEWGTPLATSITLTPGWAYYEFDLRTTQSWDNIVDIASIEFQLTQFPQWDFRFDNIAFK